MPARMSREHTASIENVPMSALCQVFRKRSGGIVVVGNHVGYPGIGFGNLHKGFSRLAEGM